MLASWAVPKGVPLEPGAQGARRPRRGPPARLRDLRRRDPGGLSTAAGRSRSGTRGTYELLEEKPDGELTVRLDGRAAAGRLDARARPHLDGKEQNWLLIRSADPAAPAPTAAAGATYEPMLATLAERRCPSAAAGSTR